MDLYVSRCLYLHRIVFKNHHGEKGKRDPILCGKEPFRSLSSGPRFTEKKMVPQHLVSGDQGQDLRYISHTSTQLQDLKDLRTT